MQALAGLIGLKRSYLRRRAAFLVGSLLAAGLSSAVAVGFLCFGLYLAFAASMRPVYAALLVGLIGAFLAAISLCLLMKAARRVEQAVERAVETSALATLAPPLLAFAARNKALVGVAAIAGLTLTAMRRR